MYKMKKMTTGICFLFLLAGGCADKGGVKSVSRPGASIQVNADRLNDIEKLERCRRELEALKKIDSAIYSKRKAEFDRLISGASLYNGVRNDVGNYTQSAVDALYRFRADKLCADISSEVLSKLSQ